MRLIERTSCQAFERIVPGLHVWPRNAGIVDQDIDATERFDGLIPRALDVGIIGDINRDSRNAAALLQFGRGFLGQPRIAIPDRNRRSGFEKTFDNCAPNTLRATCYDRVASGEIDFVCHGRLPRKN